MIENRIDTASSSLSIHTPLLANSTEALADFSHAAVGYAASEADEPIPMRDDSVATLSRRQNADIASRFV
jgi:hypothetical protein